MIWNSHSKIPNDAHAFLSPSTYSWMNYDDDKLIKVYINKLASARGTKLHELASRLIKMRIQLPNEQKTLNMFVNDSIRFKMESEKKLYYSKFCFGTADAISYEDGFLKIFDLKTGSTKVSFMQLMLYAALFFLEYDQYKIAYVNGIELRIYQNDDVKILIPEKDEIVPIMDKIIRFDRILQEMEEKYDDGFDAPWNIDS